MARSLTAHSSPAHTTTGTVTVSLLWVCSKCGSILEEVVELVIRVQHGFLAGSTAACNNEVWCSTRVTSQSPAVLLMSLSQDWRWGARKDERPSSDRSICLSRILQTRLWTAVLFLENGSCCFWAHALSEQPEQRKSRQHRMTVLQSTFVVDWEGFYVYEANELMDPRRGHENPHCQAIVCYEERIWCIRQSRRSKGHSAEGCWNSGLRELSRSVLSLRKNRAKFWGRRVEVFLGTKRLACPTLVQWVLRLFHFHCLETLDAVMR